MILAGVTVGLASFKPLFESGITWTYAGTKLQSYTDATDPQKFGAEITLRDDASVIYALYNAILSALNTGAFVEVTASLHEAIFGPEIDYRNSWDVAIDFDPSDMVSDPDNADMLEWTVTIRQPSKSFYSDSVNAGIATQWPTGINVTNISRNVSPQGHVNNQNEGYLVTSFIGHTQEVEITLEGSFTQCAELRKYLISLGSTSFALTFTEARCWIFTPATLTEQVYCLSIDDMGPSDKASQRWVVSVRFGSAPYVAPIVTTFTDPRDGEVYTITTIGTQTWMTQGLRFNTGNSVSANNDPVNDSIYGRLYDLTSTTFVPTGWHLPTKAEWETLRSYCGASVAGKTIKDNVLWNGTNVDGFKALPAGYREPMSGPFLGFGNLAFFWSDTYETGLNYWGVDLSTGSDLMGISGIPTGCMFTIRCIKD